MTLSEDDLTERDDIFNTCDELNDFLLNDLTDDSDMTRVQWQKSVKTGQSAYKQTITFGESEEEKNILF